MKRIITVLLLMSSLILGQNAWINEIHYDNDWADADEFIEVAIENASTYTLSDFSITLYNGSGGASYGSKTLNLFTVGVTDNNITLFHFTYPSNGIQNGGPDGLALDFQGTVIQFLSYEGSFTATNGVANGLTSTDIGVSETSSTPIGFSLQLNGTGVKYSDFTWATAAAQTKGTANTTQALPVELTTFSASVSDQSVNLNWETATEVNNYGFEVQRQYQVSSSKNQDWENIGFVEGHGNSNSPKYYSYSDKSVEASGKYFYRLKQVDIDGTFEYSDQVEANLGAPNKYELNQNFPNPFNPMTSIQFNIPQDNQVRLNVFNVLGEKVAELLNDNISAGYHSVNFDASHLNSGIYFYKLETNNFTQIRKMMLVK